MKKIAVLFALLLSCALCAADEITVKHEKLLYPVVRVRSGNSGGSGTVFYASDRKDNIFRTYVLTNHHVCSK